jgi:hypothetical protein
MRRPSASPRAARVARAALTALALATALLLAAAGGAQRALAQLPAGTPSQLASQPSGWIDVLPGRDLAGWVRQPWPATATLGPQQWSVDGAAHTLVCDGSGGLEWLRLDRELADAVFHVEWRFTPVPDGVKYNSGVLVRTAADLSVWHQAQVGGARSGYLLGLTPVGGKVQRVDLSSQLSAFRVRAPGEWNSYELSARGRALSLWVNGAVTSETAVDVPRGYFGLQCEGWRIEFRNLRLKPFD